MESPLRTLPYARKDGPDYRDLPVSKSRQRKIDHVRKLRKRKGWSPARIKHYAIHGMQMPGNDIVEAFKE